MCNATRSVCVRKFGLFVAVLASLLVTSNGWADDFKITALHAEPMARENVCTTIGVEGAQGVPPTLIVDHTPQAGVPIHISISDAWIAGSKTGTHDHGSGDVISDASGQTVVRLDFMKPPCGKPGSGAVSTFTISATAAGAELSTVYAKWDWNALRVLQ